MDKSGELIGSKETTSTAGNDTFKASATTLTSLDAIDGGEGTDSLLIEAAAVSFNSATAVNATVAGIESVKVTSTSGDLTIDSSKWSSTSLTVLTDSGKASIVAAATQDVSATNTAAAGANAFTVVGGKAVTINSVDTATTAAASTNTFTVGSLTLGTAAGAVTANLVEVVTDGAANAGIATGSITVNGGSTVTVNSTVAVGAGNNAADVATLGSVTVNGDGKTSSVAVTQTAATATYDGVDFTNIKVSNGAVTINDLGKATKADSITSVSLTNFGNTTITGNALTSLTVKGGTFSETADTSSGTVGIQQSAGLTTEGLIPTALTINAAGGSVGAITDTNDQYTALTVNTTATSRIDNLDFSSLKTLAFTGTAVATVAGSTTLGAATVVTSGDAGVKISSALGTGVTFTGGAGVDTISLGATTKTITTGAGNDVVTMSAAVGTKGSVDAGEGTDTLSLTAANAETLSGTTTFELGIDGFEVLSLGAAAAGETEIVDVANIDDISTVSIAGTAATVAKDTVTLVGTANADVIKVVVGGQTVTTTLTVTTGATVTTAATAVAASINANSTLKAAGISASSSAGVVTVTGDNIGTDITTATTGSTIAAGTATAANVTTGVAGGILNVSNLAAANSVTFTAGIRGATSLALASAVGTSDVANVTYKASAGFANLATLTVAGVETLNITTSDTLSTVTAFTAPISATSAKNVVVSGNAGLDFGTSTISTVLATLDASGVTSSGAAGAVKFTSGAITVSTSLTGGAGDDVLSAALAATATKSVTLSGGAGNDSLTGSSTLASTIDGGAGNDIIVGGAAADTLNGGAGNDTITTGGGLDSVTLGAGVDTVVATATGTSTSVYATITDAAAGDKIDFAGAAAGAFNATKITLASTATFADYVLEASKGAATDDISWFQFGGNTYLVQDNDASTIAFTAGADILVQLNGLVDLSASVIDGAASNVLTIG